MNERAHLELCEERSAESESSVVEREPPSLVEPPSELCRSAGASELTIIMFRVLTPASPPPFLVSRFGCELLLL